MKKFLLSISQRISGFLSVVLTIAFLPMYIMFTIPATYWLNGGSSANNFADSFGLRWVGFFQDNYSIFFLSPFLPFFGIFLLLSIFVWIYYRHDKGAGKIGFKNIILCIFAIFFLVFIPIKAAQLGYKIQEQINMDIATLNSNDNGAVAKKADFGIYLVKNNQLLVSQDDIVSYNPETYTFKLTDEAVKRLDQYSAYGIEHTPKIDNGLYQQEFSIRLRNTALLDGFFWSGLSSASHDGLVLLDSTMFTATKELTVDTGYPAGNNNPIPGEADLIEYFKSIGKLAGALETASTTTAAN
jgi:hypothetical protein